MEPRKGVGLTAAPPNKPFPGPVCLHQSMWTFANNISGADPSRPGCQTRTYTGVREQVLSRIGLLVVLENSPVVLIEFNATCYRCLHSAQVCLGFSSLLMRKMSHLDTE